MVGDFLYLLGASVCVMSSSVPIFSLQVRLLLEWGAEVMVIDNKGKLPLHLVGQSASQKNRGKSEDIKKLLKNKMPADDDQGEIRPAGIHAQVPLFSP